MREVIEQHSYGYRAAKQLLPRVFRESVPRVFREKTRDCALVTVLGVYWEKCAKDSRKSEKEFL